MNADMLLNVNTLGSFPCQCLLHGRHVEENNGHQSDEKG
jgi:hypothetical protein